MSCLSVACCSLRNPVRTHWRSLATTALRPGKLPAVQTNFTARKTSEALLQARTQRQRRELMDELFRVLAADLVQNDQDVANLAPSNVVQSLTPF